MNKDWIKYSWQPTGCELLSSGCQPLLTMDTLVRLIGQCPYIDEDDGCDGCLDLVECQAKFDYLQSAWFTEGRPVLQGKSWDEKHKKMVENEKREDEAFERHVAFWKP